MELNSNGAAMITLTPYTATIATDGGGDLDSANPSGTSTSGGNAALGWSADTLANGGIITISTDGTHVFGTKPNDPKPLLYWTGDAELPDSGIGRAASWTATFNGDQSNVYTHGDILNSYRYDHAGSDAVLGRFDFTSDELYIHRVKFDDFDVTTDFIISTGYTSLTGTLNIGDTVTGSTSGATGIIQGFSGIDIFYDNVNGTINDPVPTDFVDTEIMTTSGGASCTNSNGFGTFRSFNYKILRLWSGVPLANIYVSTQGVETPSDYKVNAEHTGLGALTPAVASHQEKGVWEYEEWVYKTGTIDVQDGEFFYLKNGQQHYLDNFRMRTTANPQKYEQLFQGQVSNGAQPDSFSYYASLYVDDSYCRVIVSDDAVLTIGTLDAADTDIQPLPPSAWATGEIIVRAVGDVSGKYFHVFNSSGVIVTTGQFI